MDKTVSLRGRQVARATQEHMHDPWTGTGVLKTWGGGAARRGIVG